VGPAHPANRPIPILCKESLASASPSAWEQCLSLESTLRTKHEKVLPVNVLSQFSPSSPAPAPLPNLVRRVRARDNGSTRMGGKGGLYYGLFESGEEEG
jgi:hypothetical protein